jgi:hypothetical protein
MLDQRRGASFSLRRPPSWPSWCGAWACGRKRRPSVGPLPDRTRPFLLVDGRDSSFCLWFDWSPCRFGHAVGSAESVFATVRHRIEDKGNVQNQAG